MSRYQSVQNIKILDEIILFLIGLGRDIQKAEITAPCLPTPTPHSHKCTIMSRKQMQILTLLTKFIQHLYIKQNQDCLVLDVCTKCPWKRNHVKSFLNSSGGGMGPAGGGKMFWYIPQIFPQACLYIMSFLDKILFILLI